MSDVSKRRTVRSFVRRQGRMAQSSVDALEQYWQDYGIDATEQELNFPEIFANTNPVILEIGFGMGASLFELAQQHPELNFLGIEVHRPGVAALVKKLHKNKINNVKVMCDDAKLILQKNIPAQSLAEILIFFPDPWPKKRHFKRRLIQLAFIDIITAKLKSGAVVYMATDWENYAQQMQEVLANCEQFEQVSTAESLIKRPETKYERRGIGLGHGVWDLVYRIS